MSILHLAIQSLDHGRPDSEIGASVGELLVFTTG
jgi:hypothetical protein